jgi:hypothetical protein
MTSKLNVVDYKDQVDGKNVYQGYTVVTNSLWVTVTKNERGTGRETQEVVFERNPQNDDWLDAAHDRIGKAIHELEAAILAAVRKED